MNSNKNNFKQVVYEEIAKTIAACGDPRRLEILELLAQCERNVETLAAMLGSGITTTSHHLQVLKHARLVRARKEGRYVFYSATDMAISLWDNLSELAFKELAVVKCAVDELFGPTSHETESLGYEELQRRISGGEAVLLDVRPAEEYAAGHIPGARSISLEELEARVGELPRDTPVFAYCRDRYCVLSQEAGEFLEDRGFSVTRLPQGITEWRAAGRALERSN
ncbi:MAG: metalloregulator ArsR/SmtB family transcription factor [Alkalispirochaeta sp.]